METVLVTFKKLHEHSYFLEIKSCTFKSCKSFQERFRRKQVIPRTLCRVTELTLFMWFLSVHKVICTFSEELLEWYPSLFQCRSLGICIIHCVKSVQIRRFSGPHFSVFSPNTGKHGPEKTLYLDTFHRVINSNFNQLFGLKDTEG